MTKADLLSAVRARIQELAAADDDESDEAFATDAPPLSELEIYRLEKQLRYRIPASVKDLYMRIANGGFGPSYGLVRLDQAIALYEEFSQPDPSDPKWRWPAALFPLINLGCGMYFCVDCSSDDARVIWFEPNPHVSGESWSDSFGSGPPFEQLMLQWASGTDTVELMESFEQAGADLWAGR